MDHYKLLLKNYVQIVSKRENFVKIVKNVVNAEYKHVHANTFVNARGF